MSTNQDHEGRTAELDATKAFYAHIPTRIRDSLDRYVTHRLRTGDFLRAVLANDLMGAIGRADEECRRVLATIVLWIYNEAPSDCYGSYKVVDAWLGGKVDQ